MNIDESFYTFLGSKAYASVFRLRAQQALKNMEAKEARIQRSAFSPPAPRNTGDGAETSEEIVVWGEKDSGGGGGGYADTDFALHVWMSEFIVIIEFPEIDFIPPNPP